MSRIAENWYRIRENIATAAKQSGRAPESVTLIAVTKYVGSSEIQTLYDLGQRDFGESRPQDLSKKIAAVPHADIRWHMIGHLQTNKVQQILPQVALIHSLDRESLIRELIRCGQTQQRVVPCLLEINISGDANKHGFRLEQAETVIEQLRQQSTIQVQGLMGMSGLDSDATKTALEFASMNDLRDRLQQQFPEQRLSELSLGMSDDYELAIAHGSTMVRVGSALFE
jgi:PLP dependent protein